MAVITFDCDEVLADLVKAVLHRNNNSILWVPLQWDDIADYFIENMPQFREKNVSFLEAKALFDAVILDHGHVEPIAGMQSLIGSLKRQGHELYVITARGDELYDATIAWLDSHYSGMFSDIVLTNHYDKAKKQCKGDVCEYLWSQLMVEDTIHNSEKVIAKDIPVVIPHKPWNRDYRPVSDLIHKADDARHIEQILVEKGLL